MKPLDKIYVDQDSFGFIHGYFPDGAHPQKAVEYIRKDALLEKLKAQQDKCVFRSTYWDFWQAVINEIKKI